MVKTTNQVYFNFKQEKSFMSSNMFWKKKQWNFTEKENYMFKQSRVMSPELLQAKWGLKHEAQQLG
jgi:hypothetical protein